MIKTFNKNISFGVRVKSMTGMAKRTLTANHGGIEKFNADLAKLKSNSDSGTLQLGHKGSFITAHYKPSSRSKTRRVEYTDTSNLTLDRIYLDMLKLLSRGKK